MTSMASSDDSITPEMHRALQIARELAEHGVPIFLAEPDEAASMGFRLPQGWQHTEPDPAVLDNWRPGMAVCAVMGRVVDAIDVDPRSGGHQGADSLDSVWPQTYGRQRTPGGGWHDLVAPLDVGSPTGTAPGIDIRGGKDGQSTGFIFIAPTRRRSKQDGGIRAYEWTDPPTITASIASDDSGRRLAERIRSRGATSVPAPTGVAVAVIPVGSRRQEVVRLAGDLRARGVSREYARSQIHDLWQRCEQRPGEPFTEQEAQSTVDDVYDRYEAPKGKSQASLVLDVIKQEFSLHVTPEGDPFAVRRDQGAAVVMLGSPEMVEQISHACHQRAGVVVSESAIRSAMSIVSHEAKSTGEPGTLSLRVVRREGEVIIDLGQGGNARCVVITAEGWSVVDSPPRGVFFRRTPATRALPEPSPNGSLEPLRALLGFEGQDPRWLLIAGWLVAAVFEDIARPMLMFIGPPGSAKTSRGRLVASVLDPREELGSTFGRNLGDDAAKARARYLVSYDNISKVDDRVSDHLCRLVTGDEIDQRLLYTNSDLHTVSYRRTGVMTAVTLPALRPDALERVIILPVERIADEERQLESELTKSFQAAHAEILGGVCDAVSTVLANLPGAQEQRVPRPRMADYFNIQAAINEDMANAYREAMNSSMEDAALTDPFVTTIQAWLRDEGGQWTGTPTQAWREAAHFRRDVVDGVNPPWWPRDARGFSTALNRASEPLRALGITVVNRRSSGQRKMDFQMEE